MLERLVMQKFTENQKKISHSLFLGPKTLDELNEKLDLSVNDISKEIKDLLKLKLFITCVKVLERSPI